MPINWKSFRITRSISVLRESPESGSYYHDEICLLRVCSVVLKILGVKIINQFGQVEVLLIILLLVLV